MLLLLFVIVSYWSLMLLLMPAKLVGILSTAAIIVVGSILMVFRKSYRIFLWKSKRYFLIPVTVFSVAYFGTLFYNRWIDSSQVKTIASIVHMPVATMLCIISLILSILSVYIVHSVLQIVFEKLLNSHSFVNTSIFFASFVTVILAQIMSGTEVFSMGLYNFLWGILIVSTVIILLYCLLGKIIPSISLGAGIFMIISTINVYVFNFRERLFEPVDIFSARTAANVAGNYSLLPIPTVILYCWGIFSAMILFLYYLQSRAKSKLAAKERCVLLAICAISSIAIIFFTNGVKTYHWYREGARYNGYIVDFVSKIKEVSMPKPNNYSIELVDNLAEQYKPDNKEYPASSAEYPHIIVIMDEAFSDLSVAGKFSTNEEIMPFISSLKENTVSGYALSSVYGGNTANSEYEFLTGNSMAWLSPNSVPYQQYIQSPTYSMVSYLKSSYNYKCMAMHPYLSSGWNRPNAYKFLGFDDCYFVDDFPQANKLRGYVSDQEMFEVLVKTYESNKENPLFIFGVTMQNHGGYNYSGENYTQEISLNGYGNKFPEVEQYLSLIHETDKAVKYLISYFENVDENVIVVFFGDHQPKISNAFYDTISETSEATLDEEQKQFKIPFFIWANYDIEEGQIDLTSLNYLSTYVYDTAGIALPSYNRFLQDMEKAIPSINAKGYFSLASGRYLNFGDAEGVEKEWLEKYEVLQYNSIFDKKHRNKILFPASE